jgi:hypothetical protein
MSAKTRTNRKVPRENKASLRQFLKTREKIIWNNDTYVRKVHGPALLKGKL